MFQIPLQYGAQRDNRPHFPKRRHAAAGRDRAKPIDRRQGQGKTNSAVAMNSPNQAHFFFIKFVTSKLLCTERWSRESGSAAVASSGLRRLELAVLTAYLAGESLLDTLARPNPHPRILSALVYRRRTSAAGPQPLQGVPGSLGKAARNPESFCMQP